MTISTTTSRAEYAGNGVTTVFAFPYPFFADVDLTVLLLRSTGVVDTLVLNTDYTVSGKNTASNGQVTLMTAPASGETLFILRELDLTQETDYISGDPFPSESHERGLDRLTLIAQQLQEQIDRCVKVSQTSGDDPDQIVADLEAAAAAAAVSAQDASDSADAAAVSQQAAADSAVAADGSADAAAVSATEALGYRNDIGNINGLVKGSGAGTFSAATPGTDYVAPDTNQTFTKAQRGAVVALTDGATITPDFSSANMFRVQLGGNRTLANPTNLVEGQSGSIDVHQDNTGSRTLSYGWGWQFAGGTAPTLSTAIRSKDKLAYQVDVAKSSDVTISIASPGVVTWNSHGLLAGQQVRLTTTGALPTGLAANTTYYVIPVDANTFQLSATRSGSAINTSGSQSGVQTMQAVSITASLLSGVN